MAPRTRCQSCPVRASSLCGEISDAALADLATIAQRVRAPKRRVIFGCQGRPRSYSVIISGVVKLIASNPDGQNQIVGLLFPSEFVGRPFSNASMLIAEAATDLELCTFTGRNFDELLQARPDIENALLKRTLADLDIAREWIFLLGRKTAEEKLAAFLFMLSERLGTATDEDAKHQFCEFELPLSRAEIAECLGIRLETVSRQLAQLKARGIIETSGRQWLAVRNTRELRHIATPCGANT